MSEQTTDRAGVVIEGDVSQSMLRRIQKILDRVEVMSNMDPRDIAKLSDQEQAQRETEIEQGTQRAAELIAKYGIDRAMLAANGTLADSTVDEALMVPRPFAAKMMHLLYIVADSMGAKATYIKTWNPQSGPKAKGGVPRGGYDYGLRIFAWGSDLERIKLLWTSLRNQALVGAGRIINNETKFGQAQKADRESYLDGWVSGLYRLLRDIEREARERAEAEEQEARDRAMEGEGPQVSGPGVAIVLADRKRALQAAYDLSRGITPELRKQWAEDNERYTKEAEEIRARRAAEIAECKRCQKAKTGRCNLHRERYGRSSYRSYERTGTRYGDGFRDGKSADLGPKTSVGAQGPGAIG